MYCNMTDYSQAVIYLLTTGDETYIGSTRVFDNRKQSHRQAIYDKNKRTTLLYKKIRENDGKFTMEIYKHFPCENKRELEAEKQKIIDQLKPNLNMNSSLTTKEETDRKRMQTITCECGCQITRTHISTHKRTKKHLNRMKNNTSILTD